MKASGEMRDKRTVTLTDDSGLSLMATFWGEVAQMNGLEIGSILAIKGAKVSEYGGKSLNVSNDSTLELNPDEQPRYHELYEWYNKGGKTQTI
jgi:replication factor A1